MITMLPGDEAFPLTYNDYYGYRGGKEAPPEHMCNYRKQKGNRENIQDIYVLLFIIFITKGQMLP